MPKILFLGDSTLDNKNWTKTNPSVTDQLQHLLPKSEIINYAVDTFQTSDMLNKESNRKDAMRVLFPHPHFRQGQKVNVLEELSKVQDPTHIVLSIGGNDVRNRLATIRSMADMQQCIEELQNNYIQIVKEIRKRQPNAQLILMNQYAVDSTNDTYAIYELLQSLNPQKTGVEILYDLMTKIYQPIFEMAADLNLPIIDMASSLDPKDTTNFVSQIEPSSKASLVIAKLIKHVVENHHPEDYSGFYIHYGQAIRGYSNLDGSWTPNAYAKYNLSLAAQGAELRQMWEEADQASNQIYSFLIGLGSSVAAVASLSSFTVAALALAGIISIAVPFVGLAIGAGVALGGLATYGFYKAFKTEAQTTKPLAIETKEPRDYMQVSAPV